MNTNIIVLGDGETWGDWETAMLVRVTPAILERLQDGEKFSAIIAADDTEVTEIAGGFGEPMALVAQKETQG